MDALQRLRPSWLRSRGASPMVSVDGGPAMELLSLRLISASLVREVRLERSTSGAGRASAPWSDGDVIVGNVIVVTTGHRGATDVRCALAVRDPAETAAQQQILQPPHRWPNALLLPRHGQMYS